MSYDIIIVGAGISGATLAERYATQKNKKVLIIE
jgi:UDP-galactopyranose mutase